MRLIVASLLFVTFLFTGHALNAEYKSYAGHQLWRLKMRNNEQVGQLLDFSRRAHQQGINFWSEEFRINVPVSCFVHCSSWDSLTFHSWYIDGYQCSTPSDA